MAVDIRSEEIVKELLTAAHTVMDSTQLSSVLVLATRRCAVNIVAELIRNGANPGYPDRTGKYPLHEAVRIRDLDITNLLLAQGAYVDARDRTGQSPLHIFAQSQRVPVSIAHSLLENGASTSLLDRNERTPLHLAAARNHLKAVEVLLEYGAPVDARDFKCQVPLFHAVLVNHIEVVKRLISARADVNLADRDNVTPLDVASPKAVPLLLHAGARTGTFGNRSESLPKLIQEYVPNWSTSVHAALVPGVRLGIETLMMIHTCPGCCAVYPGIALIPCELLFLIFEELVQQEAMERVSGMLAKLECTQDEEVAAPGAEL